MAQDVQVVGWVPHEQPITLIKLIREATACGLKEAKDAYEAILDREHVVLRVRDGRDPEALKRELRDLGLICE